MFCHERTRWVSISEVDCYYFGGVFLNSPCELFTFRHYHCTYLNTSQSSLPIHILSSYDRRPAHYTCLTTKLVFDILILYLVLLSLLTLVDVSTIVKIVDSSLICIQAVVRLVEMMGFHLIDVMEFRFDMYLPD